MESLVNFDNFKWFLGKWEGTEGTGTTRETWIKENNNSYKGIGEFEKDGKITFGERLFIQQIDEHIFYIAIPQGQKPVLFNLTNTDTDKKIVFENAEHDFPKKIVYELNGNNVNITLHGNRGGQDRHIEYTLEKKSHN